VIRKECSMSFRCQVSDIEATGWRLGDAVDWLDKRFRISRWEYGMSFLKISVSSVVLLWSDQGEFRFQVSGFRCQIPDWNTGTVNSGLEIPNFGTAIIDPTIPEFHRSIFSIIPVFQYCSSFTLFPVLDQSPIYSLAGFWVENHILHRGEIQKSESECG